MGRRSGGERSNSERGAQHGGPRPESTRSSEPARPGLARRPDEPPVPRDVDLRTLQRAVRAELRGLPKELEEIVGGYLVAAGELIDTDPELAYAHAEAARRRAARLPIVREAAAETAYAAGHYDVALSEFRALRRMTGGVDYLPVMADCERALGRPQAALKLAREAGQLELDPALSAEMTIVAAGARRDLGQQAEALRMLQQAVAGAGPAKPPREQQRQAEARLRYAYADALLANGDPAQARRWFAAASALDPQQLTDAAQRLDDLDGLRLELDEADLDPVTDHPATPGAPTAEVPRGG